jgi:hypothetical protein
MRTNLGKDLLLDPEVSEGVILYVELNNVLRMSRIWNEYPDPAAGLHGAVVKDQVAGRRKEDES